MAATTARTTARRGSNPDSTELLKATLLGDPPEYDPFTGAHLAAGEERPLSYSARAGLEAPRYCRLCGRRMVVQVRPDGWSARCARHGELDSALLERR